MAACWSFKTLPNVLGTAVRLCVCVCEKCRGNINEHVCVRQRLSALSYVCMSVYKVDCTRFLDTAFSRSSTKKRQANRKKQSARCLVAASNSSADSVTERRDRLERERETEQRPNRTIGRPLLVFAETWAALVFAAANSAAAADAAAAATAAAADWPLLSCFRLPLLLPFHSYYTSDARI